MRVIPGSEMLWSLHSGHLSCTRRRASSTSCWKVLSSRFGAGSTSVTSSGGRFDGGERIGGLVDDQIEREDEIADVVALAERVGDVDVAGRRDGRVESDDHVDHVDSWFPPGEGIVHVGGDRGGGALVSGREDVILDAAAELRSHRSLTRRGSEDQFDRLLDVAGDPTPAQQRLRHRIRPDSSSRGR